MIGVLWRPGAFTSTTFCGSHVNGRKPVVNKRRKDDVERRLAVNMEAVLEDFEILGGGLVASIDKNEHSVNRKRIKV